eukprot:700952-Pyramimonas_sp.AAC.1
MNEKSSRNPGFFARKVVVRFCEGFQESWVIREEGVLKGVLEGSRNPESSRGRFVKENSRTPGFSVR